MKKINLSIVTMAMVFATLIVVSCSQDETTTEKTTNSAQQRIANPTANDLKAEFAEIIQSSEYINLENNIKTMAYAIKGNEEVPLDSKESFEVWLTDNLSKTNFANINEALNLYNDFLTYSEKYMYKFGSFYEDLEAGDFEDSELVSILGPQLQSTPSSQITNSGPCQNYCMNECEANIDFLNEGYIEHNGWLTPRGRLNYWITYTWIVTDFNNCMSSC